MRPTPTLACASALLAWLAAGPAAAQNQVKPYFLIVFDTSGSMDTDVRTPNSANSCNFGAADPSRMEEAKCALGKLINATGDADFGLMQFAQTNCSGGSCSPTSGSALLRIPIQSNTAPAITALIDNVGSTQAEELCPNGYTPLGGVLAAAKEYYEGDLLSFDAPTENDAAIACRPLSVILLTDGVECCGDCTAASPWTVGCPKADSVLMTAGVGTCANACGFGGGCGSNTSAPNNHDAFESAPEKAYELLTESMVPSASGVVAPRDPGIQTYVIGFGMSPTGTSADEVYQRERIERIAVGGGTDNPSDGSGGLRAFYASNADELSLAFSQIIADAQPPSEICNNADDDCDTLIDEGIPKYCNKPAGQEAEELCEEPDETLCDNEDDDCDGLIDEGVRNDCGVCGDEPEEICDGVDNDCDSRVDEMTEGGECGSDEGRCETGTLRCIGGVEECRGEVGPRDEICNCQDDDCDGEIDEDPTGDLCEDGRCIACECVPRCTAEEFMPSCEGGRRPDILPSGECFCIIETCNAQECIESTITREDQVQCAPDDASVAPCLCRLGMCAARCDGVSCTSGEVCDKRNGRCVEDNCRGLGCEGGEVCDPLEAECITDPCMDVTCGRNELCRGGACEASCAGVDCEGQQSCKSGECVADLCVNVTCRNGQLCDPDDGDCVASPCLGEPCAEGLVCSLASGECERDPCWNVRCPSDQTCSDGECSRSGGGGPNLPTDGEHLLATGGGGCACHVAPGSVPRATGKAGSSANGAWAFAVLAAALILRARRRRSPASLLGAACALVALVTTGCNVDAFCIDCIDAGSNPIQGGNGGSNAGAGGTSGDGGGAGGDADGGMSGADGGDDSGLPRCTQPEPETCDGTDEDCDFRVDEDVEAEINGCVQYGVCAGTRPICLNAEFTCVYPDTREEDESLCDTIDNDCDNRVDEGHSALGDACPLGIGECQVEGQWVCADNLTDLRCEGTPADPGDEVCDGVDNDCDGEIDEPKGAPGDNPSFVIDDVVEIASNLFMYRYEASRPDASETDQGRIDERACSRAGVLPWTNLTYAEAVEACEAAGMELCSQDDWEGVCDGPLASNNANRCLWSYTPMGGSCPTASSGGYPGNASPAMKQACNGHDMTAQPGDPDVDALAVTGAFPRCYVEHGSEPVFDLSGNAKEWTVGPDSPDENPLRGGSFNNLPGGMRCDFDFAVASDTLRLRNVGFRCCSDSDPTQD